MPAHPELRIELFGGFRLFVNGRPQRRLPTPRQQQLIGFVLLHARGGPVPRQRVAGSLWPESTDVQALTNLRREMHHLREDWPALDACVDAGSRMLAWRDDAGAAVDVVGFEAAADRGSLQEAADLYTGDLLPGCDGEWIDPDRERLRQRAKAVLVQLVARLEQDGAFAKAIQYAQQLLRVDSLDEQAWRALMRCHARSGERATALHLYQECAALLRKELGVEPGATTRMTYREIVDLDAEPPAASPLPQTTVYPLVGRHSEWLALVGAWRSAAGRPRLFLIRGEAGIGKTRLAEELLDWSRMNGVSAVHARCYAGEGRLAYAPVAAWLRSDALRSVLLRLDDRWIPDLARLHPGILALRPDAPAPDGQLESWQRLRFFDSLAQAFRSAAPLVLVMDDLQWADGDTLEWLHYFVRSAADSHCLVVGTARAEEEHDNPFLGRFIHHLERDNLLTALALGPLDRTATAQLAGEVLEHEPDAAMLARIFRETEGHPLFIIERGRMESARQSGTETDGALPQVQSVVAARLALLSEQARTAAEVASAVGRDFQFDVLAQASDLEEDALVRALDELWRRQIVRVQQNERWDFTHDRIREVAYSGIGPARRRLIHRRIAQAMELLGADRLDDVSASIAVHLERGGQPARAVPFLERAAAVATRVSATEEAIRCLTHALSILEMQPPGRERDARELALRSSLSVALNSGRGYAAPEVEENLARVFALLREDPGGVPVRWLWVAFTLRFMLGDLKGTREICEEALARCGADPSCVCEAHHAMGGTLQVLGELDASRDYFEAALAAYDERHTPRSALGSDLGVFAHGWYSHTLWLLGDASAALWHIDQGIALARRLEHPYSQTIAHAYAALLHQLRLDREHVLEAGEATVSLCDRHGFGYYGQWARVLIGWARGQEEPAEAIRMIESAIERLDRERAQARRPYYLSLLADVYERLGDRDRASSIVDAAVKLALERGDSWWLPALYVRKAAFEPPDQRQLCVERALHLARAQHNRGLEQRILASTAARS